MTRNLSEDARRGLQALMLGIKHIANKNTRVKNTSFPQLVVYGGRLGHIFTIEYDSDVKSPNMYLIIQQNVGENTLAYMDQEDVRYYLTNFVGEKNIMISEIRIAFDEKRYKILYNVNVGVVFGKENCLKCYDMLQKHDIHCSYNSCYSDNIKEDVRVALSKIKNEANRKKFKDCVDMVVTKKCLSDNIRHCPTEIRYDDDLFNSLTNADETGMMYF